VSPKNASRLSAEERRELVLAAAVRAFARSGYAGTSTDSVAREAGVSQPYVVRIFGTKLDLFLDVFTMATDRIGQAFEQVLAESSFDPDREEDWDRMGTAYTGLLADRDFLLVMMHGFAAADIPEIGALARGAMASIYEILKRTGCTDEQARDFVAQGMLLNVMIAMRAPEHVAEEGPLAQLTVCAFGEALAVVAS
jgi:AcrR family transcriptional regulator